MERQLPRKPQLTSCPNFRKLEGIIKIIFSEDDQVWSLCEEAADAPHRGSEDRDEAAELSNESSAMVGFIKARCFHTCVHSSIAYNLQRVGSVHSWVNGHPKCSPSTQGNTILFGLKRGDFDTGYNMVDMKDMMFSEVAVHERTSIA